MLTDPNPPNPTIAPRPVATADPMSGSRSGPMPGPMTAVATPPLTLDATTFRRFVTAAWSRPRATTRTAARHGGMPVVPDALVAHRLQSFS